jgi:hypothetical protein
MSSRHGRGGIFLSYRREETAPYAGRLYDHLSEHFGEDRVFMDVDSIAIGTDFTKAIIEAVSRCNILLALIGRHWSAVTDAKGVRRIDYPHDFVRVEIEAALQREIRVVPILVDGASLPQSGDLPSSLRPLVMRQAIELSHTGFRSQVSHLITAIDEALEKEPHRSAETPKPASQGKVVQRDGWQLGLLDDKSFKKTFRLSSGKEVHDITVKFGAIKGGIDVDGQPEVTIYVGKSMRPYHLKALSSAIGSDVTIQLTSTWDQNKTAPSVGDAMRPFLKRPVVTLVILKIGDQVLRYEPERD